MGLQHEKRDKQEGGGGPTLQLSCQGCSFLATAAANQMHPIFLCVHEQFVRPISSLGGQRITDEHGRPTRETPEWCPCIPRQAEMVTARDIVNRRGLTEEDAHDSMST